ncbi:MAG TPA: hypothetical protein DCR48_11375 [Flavobacteriales bacterium]|nr:hypothetical protein [Flavobacteriales bacterium]
MEQQSNNKRFIKQDFDKFNNKSTSELVWPTKFSKKYISIWWNAGDSTVKDYKGMEIDLTLRHVKTPDIETCLIDYMYLGGDWMFLRNGNMIINLDGTENIKLEAKESNTDVGVGFRNAVCEIGFYSISKEELKKVCDAKEVEVRVGGANSYHSIANSDQKNSEKSILPGDKFLFMCRTFYAGLYDDSSYSSQIEAIIPVGTENAKAPAAGGGCFIATAAMGDYNHPVVMDLRLFRDNWLLKRDWGVKFTNWYYTHGPKAANIIEKSTLLRKLTFFAIVKPLQILTKRFK